VAGISRLSCRELTKTVNMEIPYLHAMRTEAPKMSAKSGHCDSYHDQCREPSVPAITHQENLGRIVPERHFMCRVFPGYIRYFMQLVGQDLRQNLDFAAIINVEGQKQSESRKMKGLPMRDGSKTAHSR
jgi:hypothetical protein